MNNEHPVAGGLRTEISRYLVVGGLAVGIDAGVYFGLVRLGSFEPAVAKRISFAAGAVWGFFANKYFTFRKPAPSLNEPLLFALVYVFGWFLNSILHDEVLRLCGIKWLAFLVATGVSTCTNFAGQKWLVFHTKRSPR